MNYIKQTDDFSCGPVAIFNVLVALGVNADLNKIKARCKATYDDGTLYNFLSSSLARSLPNSFTFRFSKYPTFEKIKSHVKTGLPVIICEYWNNGGNDGEHYFTVVGMEGHNFKITNRASNVEIITPRMLKTTLIKYHSLEITSICPLAWFVFPAKRNSRRLYSHYI